MSYSIQQITFGDDRVNYAITHDTEEEKDVRIATCYKRENAELVCCALNKQNSECHRLVLGEELKEGDEYWDNYWVVVQTRWVNRSGYLKEIHGEFKNAQFLVKCK